jgi:hypothetical protein
MTKQTIDSRIRRLTKTNTTDYPVADITDDENVAYDRVVSLILRADAKWQWDDSNETDLPVGTTDIIENQDNYSLETTHIDIYKVLIQYPDGTWHTLTPIDAIDERDRDIGKTGLPTKYDKLGTSILPLPIPNYSLTGALQLYFKRPPAYFTTSDTTKEPGFNQLYHDLIVLYPSYDRAVADGLPSANQIFARIQTLEAALVDDYAHRSPSKFIMKPRTHSSR